MKKNKIVIFGRKNPNLYTKLSIVIIDSRSSAHPDWVQTCLKTVHHQVLPIEVLVYNNIDRKHTIGYCWNELVKKANGEWILFVGDDDWLSHEYSQVLSNYISMVGKSIKGLTTNMTPFSDVSGLAKSFPRQCTGAWRKDYLLKFPFNEKLKKGIDREWIEEVSKRGDKYVLIPYYYGYFYRKHEDYSCAGDINFKLEPKDTYFVAGNQTFLDLIMGRLDKDEYIVTSNFNAKLADKAKVIWAEWGGMQAVHVANYKCNAKKILRIHAYEVFGEPIKYIDFKKFDVVIFIAEHIKKYVEDNYGKLPNAVVIPNGVDLKLFNYKEKVRNNKIAWAGYITRKKGANELFILARCFPEYEFHVAGKYQEDDVALFYREKKPDNVFIYPWQQNIVEWYQDKTYIINTSLRESQAMTVVEGMACGLKPLVYDWIGSSDVYPKEFIYNNVETLKSILDGQYDPQKYRDIVTERYDFENQYKQIRAILNP